MLLHTQYWALTHGALEGLVQAFRLDPSLADVHTKRSSSPVGGTGKRLAVIPIMGMILHRVAWLGTSVEEVRASLRQALADPSVESIILLIDSPGGSVAGISELAREIFEARVRKPIVAIADTMACSAAYHLASQATTVLATPSAEVGSIGVYGLHADLSRAMDQAGVTITFIKQPTAKAEGNEFEPLSEKARAHWQGQVDSIYASFVEDVARGRGVSTAVVKRDFGAGRTVLAREALHARMVDGIATFDDAFVVAAKRVEERRRQLASDRALMAETLAIIDESFRVK